jgi:hypothetical protein
MKNYFITIAEMCVNEELPPLVIVRKIMKWHIIPMQRVSLDLKLRIFCLDTKGCRSGYRSFRWEKSRARSGDSEHTFGQGAKGKINQNKKGAADWRCENFQLNKNKLVESIITNTAYTRIIIYNHHIHTDYKNRNDTKLIYSSDDNDKRILIRKIKKVIGKV